MSHFIYADHAATTAVSDTALQAMLPHFTAAYGNPSSLYRFAQEGKTDLERARAEIAACLNARPEEIYFTSGGTEADNWALRGLAEPRALEGAIRPDTILISIMAANNEIGTIEPVAELGRIARAHKVLFHTDAVQAVGHIPVDVEAWNVDLLSLSAHKFRGPKGVGALYVKKPLRLPALIQGGGQEKGRRSGTENVPGAVGMAAALREAVDGLSRESPRLAALRDRLIDGLTGLPYTRLTGDPVNRLPGTASFVFEGVEGEALLLHLDARGICASSGSACSSASLDPSHVLLAIGLPHAIAHGSLRLSLGAENTEADVDYILKEVPQVVAYLRELSPVWDRDAQKPTWEL